MTDTFRIATFNLENLDDTRKHGPSLAERIAFLRPQLERTSADILCLQEVNGQPSAGKAPRTLSALDRLVSDTQFANFYRAATESPSGGAIDIQNLVILSRWPIEARRQMRHDIVPAPLVSLVTAAPGETEPLTVCWDRPLLYVRVALPGGRKLHVIDLHLRAPLAAFIEGQKDAPLAWKTVGGWAEGFALAAIKRNGQALEARLLVEQLFDEDENALVVVCGDFNAEAGEVPTRLLLGDASDTGSGRLATRSLIAVEATVPAERRFSVIHAGRHVLLDHMLVSRGLLGWFRSAAIHNEGLGDELIGYAGGDNSPESYHAPVVAEFEMRER